MSASWFSQAMEMAGTISVPKSTHKIKMVDNGNGTPIVMKARKGEISGMLEDYGIEILYFHLWKRSV